MQSTITKKSVRLLLLLMMVIVGISFAFSHQEIDVSAASKYPSKVTGVKAVSAGHDSIKLTWKKVYGAKGYKIYRSTSRYGRYKLVKTTSKRTWINTKRISNKTYYYKVKAYKKVRGKIYKSKKYSSRVAAKAKLIAPTTIYASSKGNDSIKINWSKGVNCKYYQLYRALDDDGPYKRIKTTTSRTYVDTGLKTNKKYYYKVKAYNQRGGRTQYSKYTYYDSARPELDTPSIESSYDDYEVVKITWSAVDGAEKYYVYRSDGKVFETTETFFEDTEMPQSEEGFRYRVRAYHNGYSKYSEYSRYHVFEPLIPQEDAYLNYSKDGDEVSSVKLYIGQPFTEELNAAINGGVPVEKLLTRVKRGIGEDIYCYDIDDYDNFLILYVSEGEIVAWQTTAECMGVYKGIELIQGTPVTEYPDNEEWLNSKKTTPYLPESKIASYVIEIGDIYFGGIKKSTYEWNTDISEDLRAEEELCFHTINALRVMNDRTILENNAYLYGDGQTHGMYAWCITMAEARKVTHGMLDVGPLAGRTTTQRGTDVFTASGKKVLCEEENVLGGINTGGEIAANRWYRSLGHSQALMAIHNYNGVYEETSIMTTAVYKRSESTYWAWCIGRYKIDYGTPQISLVSLTPSEVTVQWTDIIAEYGYTGYYRIEFSLYEDFSTVVERSEWDETPYKIKDLVPGETYYVRVKGLPSVDGRIQSSNWSNVLKFTVPLEEIETETEETYETSLDTEPTESLIE